MRHELEVAVRSTTRVLNQNVMCSHGTNTEHQLLRGNEMFEIFFFLLIIFFYFND